MDWKWEMFALGCCFHSTCLTWSLVIFGFSIPGWILLARNEAKYKIRPPWVNSNREAFSWKRHPAVFTTCLYNWISLWVVSWDLQSTCCFWDEHRMCVCEKIKERNLHYPNRQGNHVALTWQATMNYSLLCLRTLTVCPNFNLIL